MGIDPAAVGTELPTLAVDIERGRLRAFASAIGETDPVYSDLDAARAAGHADLPVPPTFLFGLGLGRGAADFAWLADLGVDLRHVLHGEQSFTYHSPVHAGDTLTLAPKRHRRVQQARRGAAVPGPGDRRARRRRQPGRRPAGDPRRARPGGGKMTTALADAVVGTELPALELTPITRTTLALFGPASGDLNPIHLDIDVARSVGLDDVFAHGMLSMAYLGRLLANWVPQSRIRTFAVRFAAITPVHARPTCTGRVVSIEQVDGERRADLELAVTLADGTVTLTGTATVALP
jgi:acyl dehydratase